MRKRVLVVLLLGLLLLTTALACAQPGPSPTPTSKPTASPSPTRPANWPKELYMGQAEGTSKYMAIVLAQIITRNVGIPVIVEPTAGTDEGVVRLAKGEFHLFPGIPASKAFLGLVGGDPYQDVVKDGYRWIFSGYNPYNYFLVRADSGIKSYSDLKGKRITIGGPKDPTIQEAFYAAMAVDNITRKDVIEMPYGQSQDNLANLIEGKADVAIMVGGEPKSFLVEAMRTAPLRILPMSPVEQTAATSVRGYVAASLPGGLYPGHDNPTPIYGERPHSGSVMKTLPDDLVYEITKAIFEHLDQVRDAYAGFKEITTAWASNSSYLVIPAHPGAVKYLTQAGLWKDQDVKTNDALLAALQAELKQK